MLSLARRLPSLPGYAATRSPAKSDCSQSAAGKRIATIQNAAVWIAVGFEAHTGDRVWESDRVTSGERIPGRCTKPAVIKTG